MHHNIILDTDMDTDCDDAAALAVLHALADSGQVRILGVVADVANPWAAACVKAINIACGRSELPVGLKSQTLKTSLDYMAHYRQVQKNGRIYNERVARRAGILPGDNFFPEDGVSLYRRLLTNAEDGSVTICCIGMLSVIAALLKSGPCRYSSVTGEKLVAAKVNKLVTMAKASYPFGKDEFNWEMDRGAASIVINDWPTPIWVNQFGDNILTGCSSTGCLLTDNPLMTAYRIFGLGKQGFLRPSWDQITVLAAAGHNGMLTEEPGGKLVYDSRTGRHQWLPASNNRCCYLEPLVDNDVLAEHIEKLMTMPFAKQVII